MVAQAVWGMARNLCTDSLRVTLMLIAACAVLLEPSAWAQVGVIQARFFFVVEPDLAGGHGYLADVRAVRRRAVP